MNSCPLPLGRREIVVMAHGGGGRLSAELLRRVILPALGARGPASLDDAADLFADLGFEPAPGARIALATDAHVVRPLFFPGGDVGSLAVFGAVNDLAMRGARPVALTLAFILEEGLPLETLARVCESIRQACDAAAPGLRVACGDTKVVERRGSGRSGGDEDPGDSDEPGLTLATTALGEIPPTRAGSAPAATRIRPGDVAIVSGPVGDHGMAILSVREGLAFDSPIRSDAAPLGGLVEAMLAAGEVRALRDPTRGGLAAALHELAGASSVSIRIDEAAIPVRPEVAEACEMLGLDPLHVACEGRLLAFVAPGDVEAVLAAMRARPEGAAATVVGVAEAPEEPGRPEVVARNPYGIDRPIDLPAGDQLPRIC